MQPLNTMASPEAGSANGCAARSLRSMIFSRRWPSATGPRASTPAPSGPRAAMASAIVSTAAAEARAPSNRISPHKPHMSRRDPFV